MPYLRVIPRDLFNEASLLKCYGRLAILLGEPEAVGHKARLDHDGGSFEVAQDPADGSITLWPSVRFVVQFEGEEAGVRLYRPLNSREEWPLYAEDPAGEEVPVFRGDSGLTREFLDLIRDRDPGDDRSYAERGATGGAVSSIADGAR